MKTRCTVLILLLGVTSHRAAAQIITPVTGSDVLPRVVAGKIVTDAHDDATLAEVPNVRVFGYSFQRDPDDPYFITDPGFNAPAGSGLPAGNVLSFTTRDTLGYWSGNRSSVVALTPPPLGEGLAYTFGSQATQLTGTSGVGGGIQIGTIASNGSIHRHMNAFLLDATHDPTNSFDGHPSDGVYVATLSLGTGGGIADSDPLYMVYGDGVDRSAVDRAKFQIRNHLAPGTQLASTATNLIGLSPLPGEANLATGGAVLVTSGGAVSEIDDLTSNSSRGSAVIDHVPQVGSTLAMLWLSGTGGDVAQLIASLDGVGGYDVAAANVPPSDPLYLDVQALSSSYPGFSALVKFDPGLENGALTWDFAANPAVTLDRVAVVPEPSIIGVLALVLAGGVMSRRRHRGLRDPGVSPPRCMRVTHGTWLPLETTPRFALATTPTPLFARALVAATSA
jgi:hypothetical protein